MVARSLYGLIGFTFALLTVNPVISDAQTHLELQPSSGGGEVIMSGTQLITRPREVTMFWLKHHDVLKKHFKGYAKWENEDKGILAETGEYYLNYVMIDNHELRQKFRNRGCEVGFYRCWWPEDAGYIVIPPPHNHHGSAKHNLPSENQK